MNSTQRIYWIDWAKCLLIILVVVGHTEVPTEVRRLIYGFHMPAFFIISGFLHKPAANLRAGLVKNFHRMLIPYGAFALVFYLLWNLPACVYLGHLNWTQAVIEPLGGFIFGRGTYSAPIIFAAWFITVLFCIFPILDWVDKIAPRGGGVITTSLLCVVLTAILYHTDNGGSHWFYYPLRIVVCFPFVAFGYLMKKKCLSIALPLHHKGARLALAAFLLATYATAALTLGLLDINSFRFGPSVLAYYATATAGSLGCFCALSFVQSTNHFVDTLSRGTIVVLYAHILFRNYLRYVIHNPWLLAALMLGCAYILIEISFRRHLWFFTGVRKK